MSSWHHRPCYDVIGFPYIRRRAWPIEDLPHLGLRVHLTSVQSSTAGYSCMLGSARWHIPISGAYFLQLYLIELLLLWASPRALTPRNTPTHLSECNLEYFARRLHRTNLLSVSACEHCSGCTSLHLRKRIATRATHHPPAWHTSHIK